MTRWHLVTGASSGIGLEITKALLRRGDSVMTVQRRKPPIGTVLGSEGTSRIGWVQCDFGGPLIPEAAKEIADSSVSLDSFIFCAGMQDRKADQWNVGHWDEFLRVNALGQARLYEALESHYKVAENPSVLVVSSFLARNGSPWCPAYAASKLLMESYWQSKVLQRVKEERCPRVNFLWPGQVETRSNPQRAGVTLKSAISVVPHALYIIDNEDIRNQTIDAGG